MSEKKNTFDNLDMYARNDDVESEQGIDVGFPNGIIFTVLRAGGSNHKYKRAVRKYITPTLERKISKGTLLQEEDNGLWRNIYADAVIVGVSGAVMNGEPMPFTKDNVKALLQAGPDMLEELRNVCDNMMSFRKQEIDEVAETLGNSSSGKVHGVPKRSISSN